MTFDDIKKIKFNNAVSNENSIVILGNCLINLNLIEDKSIDLIFADPPYNIGKDFGNNKDKWNSTTITAFINIIFINYTIIMIKAMPFLKTNI